MEGKSIGNIIVQGRKINSVRAIGVVWFSTIVATTGIVLAYNPSTGKMQAYIGSISEPNPKEHIQEIMEFGALFPTKEAINIIDRHGDVLVPRAEFNYLTIDFYEKNISKGVSLNSQ